MVNSFLLVCAACGCESSDLKLCNACKSVKYCSRECQRTHWPAHKTACKKRAAALLDERLFADPPPREECPICTLPMPIEGPHTSYQACCGQIVCCGCCHSEDVKMRTTTRVGRLEISKSPPCPFCRTPRPESRREANERCEKRMALGDANAYIQRAGDYSLGDNGTPLDYGRAFELFTRAAELGSSEAQYELGNVYRSGKGRDINIKKAKHHYQLGAIGGDIMARSNLAVIEAQQGNTHRAMKHFTIAARNGFGKGMDGLRMGFSQGLITKEELLETLNAYNFAVDEMTSDDRDVASSDQRDLGAEYAAYMNSV